MVSLLNQLSDVRVLVVGDLMLDHYIWGDVQRISPEAPVPVVHVARDTYTAGGAANVALNLKNLGVQTSVLGFIGKDEAGEKLEHMLSDNRIDILRVANSCGAPTIIKTRVIIRNQQLCRIDREGGRDQYKLDSCPDLQLVLNNALENVDAVIISDYAKGAISQPLIDYLLDYASKHSRLLIAMDPKPSRSLAFPRVGLLTPNRSEALQLAGMRDLHPDEKYPLSEICQLIYQQYQPDLLIVTLGAEGMAISIKGEVQEHLVTEAREVFDVSGAGDTVIATLTAAVAAGATPSEAARLANAAAGCVVGHMGTVPITLDELYQRLINTGETIALTKMPNET